MIEFFYHPGIEKEIKDLEKRFPSLKQGFASMELLCQKQFHPTEPAQVIAPAKLHRVTQNDIWALWKVELVIPRSNLRPNQWPRMWFAVKGSIIVFLCIASHIDNYDNETMSTVAISRASDFF